MVTTQIQRKGGKATVTSGVERKARFDNANRARVNPIVFIPPAILLIAIAGILIYRYQDTIQDTWHNIHYRMHGEHPLDGAGEGEELFEEDYYEEEEDADQDTSTHTPVLDDGHDQEEEQAEIQPEGSTTSARLRMHHDMVQQMRARAGFAPEPFPGDEEEGGGDEEEDGEGEVEDDGGVGSSTGASASASRIKKIGKKKAEKLQRKEQMRAYREFMDMQREERRQQEELFKVQEELQQEERRRKRSAQIEKDRKRKEQLKEKEAKENDSKIKRIQDERIKQEKARQELRAYIQRIKSFRLSTLAEKLGRTEAQLLKDLAAVAQEDEVGTSSQETELVPRITLASSLIVPPLFSSSSSPSSGANSLSAHPGSSRPRRLIVHDPASGQYVVLDETQLDAFAELVKGKGRVDKKELCEASKGIFSPLPPIN